MLRSEGMDRRLIADPVISRIQRLRACGGPQGAQRFIEPYLAWSAVSRLPVASKRCAMCCNTKRGPCVNKGWGRPPALCDPPQSVGAAGMLVWHQGQPSVRLVPALEGPGVIDGCGLGRGD